jgi:hypothetical protein
MAAKEWHVVNLVSRTQHQRGKDNARSSFADPTAHVLSYLSSESQSCFTYRTWEDLYAGLITGKTELKDLDGYMRNKSAHLMRLRIGARKGNFGNAWLTLQCG